MALLDDAFSVPPSSALARPRLLTLLSSVERTGLALVVAPVGYGKTTLLGQWSAARGGVVRWYEPNRLPSRDAVRRDLDSTPMLRGIVVDDVHRIGGVAAAARLERLIEDVAPEVPVVLGARRLPAFNLARHEFPRAIVITTRDLSFRPWEVAELFADVYADPLQNEEPLAVADRTEGWAAALRLWHLARRMDREDVPGEQPPDCVRAYLARQVLNGLDPELLRLMRTSSVFDVVTADRVDRLMGIGNGHRLLIDLARRVDLVTVRPDGRSYRYHRTLRDHLRAELAEELGPSATRALFDDAAVVLEELGDLPEALASRCRAQNSRDAARLLVFHGRGLTDAPGDWLDMLSASMAGAEPQVRLARARLLLADGMTREAETEATTAACHLTDLEDRAYCELVASQARLRRAGFATKEPAGPPSPAVEAVRLLVQG
ncbi:MAG TPA: hypothetical protein VHM65_08380, partial [Candidatus Lustribacter sp.]|nr:hypothetical protein [Candidatus Lustribacter sp.]